MNIRNLSAKEARIEPRNERYVSVDLSGVDGDDLVSCMDERLLRDVVAAIGADKCVDILDLQLAE